jgi:DnaA-homolog protein
VIQPLLKQLPLGFNQQEEVSFENYYAGKNAEIVDYLKRVIDYRVSENSYLCSVQGLGRSHLLHAVCRYAEGMGISSVYVPLIQVQQSTPKVLSELETISLICIDDLQVIAGKPAWEEALFYLYNRVQATGNRLIVTANGLPKEINISLPDLVSRLTWGMIYQLQNLQDHEKVSMLMMRAKRRGMLLPIDVAQYILTHCPRHMSTLVTALDVLDKATLAAQRRLTIPFVKHILQI